MSRGASGAKFEGGDKFRDFSASNTDTVPTGPRLYPTLPDSTPTPSRQAPTTPRQHPDCPPIHPDCARLSPTWPNSNPTMPRLIPTGPRQHYDRAPTDPDSATTRPDSALTAIYEADLWLKSLSGSVVVLPGSVGTLSGLCRELSWC